MKATKILKYLNDKAIDYAYNGIDIVITLDADCVWINGYKQEMHYNKDIYITKNKYNTYFVIETTGFNMHKTLCNTSKQAEVIRVLQERLG